LGFPLCDDFKNPLISSPPLNILLSPDYFDNDVDILFKGDNMKIFIVVLAAFGFVASANAASGTGALKGNGVYGSAGCGLGSMVFGNEEGAMQVVAATLNSTGVQTFGITSGTSNCGKGLFAKAEVNSFIQSNAIALENDIARGQGETLSTLNNMLGCGAQFSGQLQQNFKSIYAPGVNSSEKIISMADSCQG
jgi:hypothetical protein